jgi:hypothetical protein
MKTLRLNHTLKTAGTALGISDDSLSAIFVGADTNNKVVKKAIEMKLCGLEKTEASLGSFSDPNWAHKEAFILGMKSAYKEILELMRYEEVENVNRI